MKTATVSELKKEIKHMDHHESMELCLRLARFKKENKDLLTYLIFEAADEDAFIESVKQEIEDEFEEINTTRYYFIKKSVRKILKMVKKYARYSPHKTTEIELLLHFCRVMSSMTPSYQRNQTLVNLYLRQVEFIRKKVSALDEDLQYDYGIELEELNP